MAVVVVPLYCINKLCCRRDIYREQRGPVDKVQYRGDARVAGKLCSASRRASFKVTLGGNWRTRKVRTTSRKIQTRHRISVYDALLSRARGHDM